MKKVLSIWEGGFWEFDLPEKFSKAEEAHEVEGGFNFLDGPVENPKTRHIGFLPSEHWLRDISEESEEDEEAEEDEESLNIKQSGMFRQF